MDNSNIHHRVSAEQDTALSLQRCALPRVHGDRPRRGRSG